MLTQAATIVRMLALAFWVGGGTALDFIDAPVRFAGGIIDRNQAVGLGQLVIDRWIRAEWVLGVVALVASLVAAGPAWVTVLIGSMLVVVTVQGAYLAPAITALSRGLDFVHRVPQDPRYVSIRHLHTAYSACEVAVLLAAAVALAATARTARR